MISRRGFLGMLIGGIAATAAEPTWPFRVYSFPTQVIEPPPAALTVAALNEISKRFYAGAIPDILFVPSPVYHYLKQWAPQLVKDRHDDEQFHGPNLYSLVDSDEPGPFRLATEPPPPGTLFLPGPGRRPLPPPGSPHRLSGIPATDDTSMTSSIPTIQPAWSDSHR